MNEKSLTLIALGAVALTGIAVACGHESDTPAGPTNTGVGNTGTSRSKLKLRTEDGYEIVVADPAHFGAQQQKRSKQGDRAAARARENLVLTPTSPELKLSSLPTFGA